MFVNERTLFVGVTFEADSVSLRHSLNLAQRGRAMHIMAITALNQSLINSMVKWFRKISFGSDVAAKAKSRLRVNQQVLGFCRVVGRVAIQAAHVVAGVHGTGEVALLVALTVAIQTASVRVLVR